MRFPFLLGGSGVDIDTDVSLTADSDAKVASQKATKSYVDAHVGGGVTYPEVANYAALPAAAGESGNTYLVRAAQGVRFVNRKAAGLYRSDGSAWTRLDDESEAYFQDTLAWSNITSKPSFAPVATTGAYSDLSGTPTLGTAAPLNVPASGNAAAGEVVKGSDTRLDVATTVHAATGKATPVDADEVGIVDSAASNVLKKLTWANLKATLKTYFDTLYQAAGSYITNGGALGTPSSGTLTNCTFPTLNQNTSGTAANLSGTPALPNGTTGTTQGAGDNSTKLATDEYVDRALSVRVTNAQGGNYTLVAADQFKEIEMTSGSANTLTVPPNSSVAFPVGTEIPGWTSGAGQTTITPGAAVTINARGGTLKSAGQYAAWMLKKTATDTWLLTGDLTT